MQNNESIMYPECPLKCIELIFMICLFYLKVPQKELEQRLGGKECWWLLQKALFPVPISRQLQLPVTTSPQNLILSSGIHGYSQTHMCKVNEDTHKGTHK